MGIQRRPTTTRMRCQRPREIGVLGAWRNCSSSAWLRRRDCFRGRIRIEPDPGQLRICSMSGIFVRQLGLLIAVSLVLPPLCCGQLGPETDALVVQPVCCSSDAPLRSDDPCRPTDPAGECCLSDLALQCKTVSIAGGHLVEERPVAGVACCSPIRSTPSAQCASASAPPIRMLQCVWLN